MKKILTVIFFLLFIIATSCITKNQVLSPIITTTSREIETKLTSQATYLQAKSTNQGFTLLNSVKSANKIWWTKDGKIICKECSLIGGEKVEWGIIDPGDDVFNKLNGLNYFFTEQEIALFTQNGRKVYDFSISPSKKRVILEFETLLETTTTIRSPGLPPNENFTVYLYSNSDKSFKNIDISHLNSCIEQINDFGTWSDNENFILVNCQANFDETSTALVYNITSQSFIDLRKVINSQDAVVAAFSGDGNNIAITNLRNKIFIFNFQKVLAGKYDPLYVIEADNPSRVEWSSDSQWLYFDQFGITQRISRINIQSFEVQPVFSVKIDQSSTNQSAPSNIFSEWNISSDDHSILLNDGRIWIYHMQDK